jgi:hypothetical protein
MKHEREQTNARRCHTSTFIIHTSAVCPKSGELGEGSCEKTYFSMLESAK